MTRCTDLDDETHDVLQAVTRAGKTKNGMSKTTADTLAEKLNLTPGDIRLLLEDLAAAGFIVTDEYRRIRVFHPCSCENPQMGLDTEGGSEVNRAPAPARTLDGSSQGESAPPTGGPPPLVRRSPRRDLLKPEETAEIPRDSPEPGRAVGKRGTRRVRRVPVSAFELAWSFERSLKRMQREFGVTWVGGTSIDGLRAAIGRWLSDGDASPELVQAMIDDFCRSPARIRAGQPAWRSFIADRQALANRVLEASRAKQPCADPEEWLGFQAPTSSDEQEWLAW